ncbi:hypothetical protein ElyMa_001938000 [Elysia marginata]|uniref:Uncharacterized protein n=1 Tax=Elysia marginata TaxID=1093978 RepID=A0AAV4EWX6_9GAST|nr:hypothetical protein ElyMa_001938000 [Elysia marginata]
MSKKSTHDVKDSDLTGSLHGKNLELLRDAISLNFDSTDLKARLNKCDVSYITNWKDEFNFDLIHHCILEKNIVALLLLLSRGLFKSPYEPSTWPYLHLVACLGHKTLISTVVQELKYQNEPIIPDWSAYFAKVERRSPGVSQS